MGEGRYCNFRTESRPFRPNHFVTLVILRGIESYDTVKTHRTARFQVVFNYPSASRPLRNLELAGPLNS
jgi:hypothetical protein